MKSNPTSKSQQIENSNYDKFALTVMSISTLRTMLCPDWASWLPATVLTRHSKSPPSSCSNPLAASSDHWTACQKHPFCIANTVRIPSGAGMCHLDPFNVCMYIYIHISMCVWAYLNISEHISHINIYCNPHPFRSLVSPNQIRPAFVHVLLVRRTDLFSQAIQASLFGFWLLMDLVKLLVHLVKIQKESQLSRHSSSLSTWRIWVHSLTAPKQKICFQWSS